MLQKCHFTAAKQQLIDSDIITLWCTYNQLFSYNGDNASLIFTFPIRGVTLPRKDCVAQMHNYVIVNMSDTST